MKAKSLLALIVACCAVPSLSNAQEGYFDSNGVKIHYVTAGEGEAVVLIHGWMADTTMWGADAAGNTKLSPLPGFEVIAIDCRGHGKSDKPHDSSKYGAEMAEDVVRLLDHLNIKKAHLIGYSMGSFIAGKVAASHPDRILSIVYGGQAPLLTGESGSKEIEVFAKAVDEGKGLGAYILYVSPSDKPKPTPEQADAIAKFMLGKKDVKALALAGLSFKGLEVTSDALVKCKAPTLFIYGSKESDNLHQRVDALNKMLAGSEVKIVEGADHMTTLVNPAFGSTLVAFLQAHKSK